MFFVAEDTGAELAKNFRSLVDSPIDVRAISKVTRDDGAEKAKFVGEGYEAPTVTTAKRASVRSSSLYKLLHID